MNIIRKRIDLARLDVSAKKATKRKISSSR